MEPFTRLTPTKSEDTKREYVKCYERLRRRFGNELGKKDLAPDEVVAHLILQRTSFAKRTWRHYKASVIYWLETFSPQSETAIEVLRSHGSAGLRDGGANTSARKRKDVPDSIWNEIKYAIRERIKRGHKHAAKLLSVCEATLAAGLRPNEWAFSELTRHDDNHRLVLRVRNSKHTNGRANGEYREMYVDELTEDELRAVREALDACAVDAHDETDVHEQAAKLQLALKHELEAARALAVAGQRRPRSSITLYSFRHQFSANAKRTFENPVLTAALLGHSSTHTGFQHYGKRRNASSRVRVYPTEASVAAVQNRYLETYRDHVAQRGAKAAPGPMNP
ncbi:site-specific integrase [Ralstonia sp. ASV6]|uniref:site-specific integrase n=1 Tax=Ralstonia sp. ASV6 TaxID=2795124 RepID=UPI0018EA8126|nr:site-specific integrase [Ralstonia sp. ASV6]